MEFIVVLLVIGASLAFVIWLIERTNSAARRIDELTIQQTYFEQELTRLRRRLDAAEGSAVAERPSKPALALSPKESVTDVTGRVAELPHPPLPPVRPPETIPVTPPPTPLAIPSPPLVVPREPTPARPMPWDTINWEQFLGVKLFAWIGGLALFLAVVFFVKYAFEHNLISPALRVAAGFLVGVGLLGGGTLLHRRKQYTVGAQALCGTGAVILYATTYAARSFYSLLGTVPAFGLMVLITATAFLLAVRLNALVVAILGLCGGFLTPVLLSTGQDNPVGLFGYIAFLNVGLLAVALNKRWDFLALLAAVGTVSMQLGWVSEFFEREKYFEGNKVLIACTVFLVFCVLFLAVWLWAQRRNKANAWLTVSAIALTAVAMLFSIDLLGYEALGQRPGLVFSYVLLVDLCLLVFPWLEQKLADVHLAAGVAVFLVLAIWTREHLSSELLYWALALYLAFALLHAALPLVFRHLCPSRAAAGWERVFPLSAILPFLLLILVTTRLPLADPSPVFGLALLLSVLLLGLTRISPLSWLPAVGLGCVLVLAHVWHFRHFTPDAAAAPLFWYLGFTLLFAGFPFLFWRQFAEQIVPWATAALAGPLHFYLVHRLVKAAWPNDHMGLLPAAFALPSAAGLVFLIRSLAADAPRRLALLAWFGGATLFFVTLIPPVQFDRQWITLGWALEGAALLWLFHRVPHEGLRLTGVVLLIVAFARLALNPAVLEYQARGATPILNWYLYTYGVVIACLFVGSRLLAPPRQFVLKGNGQTVLATLGTVLAFLLLNIEIADYFTEVGTSTLTFEFSGDFGRDMTYSIGWAVFALGLVVAGIWKRIGSARWAGIVLLCVTLAKLFLHDLARLGQLYRIGAFLGVAVIAIAASLLYQRFLAADLKRDDAPAGSQPDEPQKPR